MSTARTSPRRIHGWLVASLGAAAALALAIGMTPMPASAAPVTTPTPPSAPAPAPAPAPAGPAWQAPADPPAAPVGGMVGAALVQGWGLYLTTSTGTRPDPLTAFTDDAPYHAEYDPLGQRIAVSSYKGLLLAASDGTGRTVVPKTVAYSNFSWHPQQPNRLVAASSKGVVTIALTAGNPIVKPLPIPFRPISVTYSPDGSRLLAVRNDASTGGLNRPFIYRANGTGGQQIILTQGAVEIQWNPTGDGLVYGDYFHGFERKLGSAKARTLFSMKYGDILGTDAAGNVLFSDDRVGDGWPELYAYDLGDAATTHLSSPRIILSHYSAAPIGASDLGSCDGLAATITGTEGNDRITGTPGADIIRGLGGNDVINGLGGNDILCGGDGTDTLSGGPGDDRVFGDAGPDRLQGNDGDDRLGGGAGADVADGGAGDDRVDGGEDNDQLLGGSGADEIRGGFGNDRIDGGIDDDAVYGEPGADVVHGGDGNDLVMGEYRWNAPASGHDTIYGDAGDDKVVQARGAGGTAYGGSGKDYLAYSDNMYGDDGADELERGTNAHGGAGNDILGRSVDNSYGDAGDDVITMVSYDCTYHDGCTADGGDGNDTVTGNNRNDVLRGGSGDDVINGVLGNDTIDGGAGLDEIHGGFGNDTITGGEDADEIQGDSGNDTLAGDGGDDELVGGTGADVIRGGDGADAISAFDQDDKLYGDAGNDSLTGGSGDDFLNGGAGTDRCDGSAGIDTGVQCEIRVSLEH